MCIVLVASSSILASLLVEVVVVGRLGSCHVLWCSRSPFLTSSSSVGFPPDDVQELLDLLFTLLVVSLHAFEFGCTVFVKAVEAAAAVLIPEKVRVEILAVLPVSAPPGTHQVELAWFYVFSILVPLDFFYR